MRALLLSLVAVVATLASSMAQAVPIEYSVAYSGSKIGSAGTGSFSWDADTSEFNNFIWDFPPVVGSLMGNDWRTTLFGGTMGQFLFEILTGEDVHPAACRVASRCSFSSANITSKSLTSVEFRAFAPGTAEYLFRSGGAVLYSGALSVTRVAVNEPLSLFLMGAGLLALAVGRRKLRGNDC